MPHYKQLTLLHSNDMHGDFLAEDENGTLTGGVSMLSGYVSRVRREEENVVYCVAGDMFSGSVIDSEYHGLSTVEIMNMLAPDVAAPGNHEADYGTAHMLFVEKCAMFPFVNANMRVTATGRRLFRPCAVIERGGMKILFIGVITPEVLMQTAKDELTGDLITVTDAREEIGRVCGAFRTRDIDLTVLLTHIGFEEDKKLAASLDPAWGVDVIIGGHSHTVPDRPEVVNGIYIVQAGVGTDMIGRFDLTVDTDDNSVADMRWRTVSVTPENCPRDEKLERLVADLKAKTDLKYDRAIACLPTELTHPARTQETSLGSFLCDLLTERFGLDTMLLSSGSLRSERFGPVVTVADLNECLPFDDAVNAFKVTGAQLKRMLAFMLRDEVWTGVHCEFYQLSAAMNVVYDRGSHSFLRFDVHGRPAEDGALYTVALQQYHFDNFTDFFSVPREEVERNAAPAVLAVSTRDAIEQCLAEAGSRPLPSPGRLKII